MEEIETVIKESEEWKIYRKKLQAMKKMKK